MQFPGSSFLGLIKHKLRKDPPAEGPQNGDGASPRVPTNKGPAAAYGTEPIALATPSQSIIPRGLHEIIGPFIDPEDRDPEDRGPGQPEQEADHPGAPARPLDQTGIPAPSDIGLVAPGGVPATPEIAGEGEGEAEVLVEVSTEDSIEDSIEESIEESIEDLTEDSIDESSPDSENGKMELREMFARKSVSNPTIKALLKRHQAVNTRALSRELREFALQLGLSPPRV